MSIAANIKNGDFKAEKHVPSITILENNGDVYLVEVAVGKDIAHPNTAEHFISHIDLYFKGESGAIVQLGRAEFLGHISAVSEPCAVFKCKIAEKGKLHAVSYCNIHGLWEGELSI